MTSRLVIPFWNFSGPVLRVPGPRPRRASDLTNLHVMSMISLHTGVRLPVHRDAGATFANPGGAFLSRQGAVPAACSSLRHASRARRVAAAGANGSNGASGANGATATSSKGFGKEAQSAAARLNKLRENSAALRELLEKRAEATGAPTTSNGSGDKGASGVPARSSSPSSAVGDYSSMVTSARSMVNVTFWMKFHVDYGQHIVLVGSMPELGNWVLADGINLTWSEGDMWNATVELPSTSVVEYKYVVVGQGGHAHAWQSGNNSVLAVSESDEDVEVHDNWGGSPGAKVVSGGNLPVTREKKLLSWATELETSVIQQRQELRKLRMELVTAQEEARLAREEAKKLKRQLAESEAVQATNSQAIRDVAAVNNVLKEQIKETTRGFREALTAAVDILEAESSKKATRRGSTKK